MVVFDALADRYINYLIFEKGLSEKTIESYTRDLSRYFEFIEENGIDNIAEAGTAIILKHLMGLRDAGLGQRSRRASGLRRRR